MKEKLKQRLKELRAEFEAGQKMLAEMELKQENLRNTLMRISGAIQVLEEELGTGDDNDQSPQQSLLKPEELVEPEAKDADN